MSKRNMFEKACIIAALDGHEDPWITIGNLFFHPGLDKITCNRIETLCEELVEEGVLRMRIEENRCSHCGGPHGEKKLVGLVK